MRGFQVVLPPFSAALTIFLFSQKPLKNTRECFRPSTKRNSAKTTTKNVLRTARRATQTKNKHRNTHRMRRFKVEPYRNVRWVFFHFAFVGVCFNWNSLRVNKPISVRLHGALGSNRLAVLAFHSRHRYNPLLTKLTNINTIHKLAVGNSLWIII